jgi:hypothetical protein
MEAIFWAIWTSLVKIVSSREAITDRYFVTARRVLFDSFQDILV